MRTELMDLPKEIVFDILSRLPVTSLCCIRCVCKALLHTVDDRFFVSLHTARLVTATNPVADDDHQVPCRLMFFFGCLPYMRPEFTGDFMVLQSMKYDGSTGGLTERKYAVRVSGSDISYRAEYSVHFVYCNLFFFKSKYLQEAFLLNPLRKGEVLRLARVKRYGNVTTGDWYSHQTWANPDSPPTCGEWYGMGFDSISKTHKILRVSWSKTSEGICQVAEILVLGTRSWREISSVPPACLDLMTNGKSLDWVNKMKTLCAYGDMHWLISGGKKLGTSHILLSFDFKKEEFYSIPHPPLKSSHSQPHNFHLLTLRGSMAILDASLSEGHMNISIWVLKDYDNKQWTRDYYEKIKPPETLPQFHIFSHAVCGEWEHGIFYTFGSFRNRILFLDLRCTDVKWVILRPPYNCEYINIFNYTDSLISLKDYDSVNSEEFITEGSEGLKNYGDLTEGEEQGFSISEKHMLRGTSFI